tara:strand:+ start:17696 stop:18970 length:1275 start_codon:yes stop_codon:yes gene_type:complete
MPNHYGNAGGNRGRGNLASNTQRLNQGASQGTAFSQQTQDQSINLSFGAALSVGDVLTTQTKVTKGYFTGDTGLLTGNLIHTGSLGSTNLPYYYNLTNNHPLSSSVATQFAITFGHRGGSGSQCLDGTGNETLVGPSKAIYNQLATLVLPEGEVSGGFEISKQGNHAETAAGPLTGPDEYIYALIGQRGRFKDELDYGNWTLKLKGQNSDGTDTRTLYLTDDSKDTSATVKNSIYGRKFNIVSGSVGNTISSSAYRTFGWYYPEAGMMILSGHELSASIPGQTNTKHMTASFDASVTAGTHLTHSGFAPNLHNGGNPQNALRLATCMRYINTAEQRFRSAQIQNKKSYFLTVPPSACNFSTNPTFTSGSAGKIRHKSMYGNPNVFITTVGLHRSDGRLVAVAKLSSPIIKNFGVQTTIKVNLTY